MHVSCVCCTQTPEAPLITPPLLFKPFATAAVIIGAIVIAVTQSSLKTETMVRLGEHEWLTSRPTLPAR